MGLQIWGYLPQTQCVLKIDTLNNWQDQHLFLHLWSKYSHGRKGQIEALETSPFSPGGGNPKVIADSPEDG